jgi:broad specificity phosphatase PhoE
MARADGRAVNSGGDGVHTRGIRCLHQHWQGTSMTKVILTRHGHVEGISPERFRGRTDLPLTELGQAQAKAVATRIARAWKPSMIYTSPMSRCIATGDVIAKACQVASQTLEDLNDLDYGQWQWRTDQEVRVSWPELLSGWRATPHLVRFPDGDSLQDLVVRTANALRFVMSRHRGAMETVVLVGHDSVNRALLLQLLEQPLSAYWRIAQGPCAINEIDIVDGSVRVLRINETYHLDSISSAP